jgi:site-specific DNA-methyltransferase (adenine-specific)
MKIQIDETLRALLPRLPSGELAALKADIEARGVRVPIDVAADGTVLDGHHRYEIAPDCPYEVVPDSELWGQREKRAYALRQGGLRRHLSGEQKAEYNRQRRELARELIEEDGYTQAVVAGMLGVDQGTIARWADTSSMRAHKASNPPPRDHRRKVKEDEEDEIIEQLATGKTQQEVADEHEISQQRVAQIKKKREREAKKDEPPETKERAKGADATRCKLIYGDCVEELPKIKAGSVDLIFADPPYNIGIDYGQGKKADLLPAADYIDWCANWIGCCVNTLAADGSMWVMVNDEWAAHFYILLEEAGLIHRSWVKWYETFGINCPKKFNRTSRHIFYCIVDPKRFTFNKDAVRRPSDRQTKYNDKRANTKGKTWDDVWQIPRRTGTCDERIRGFPTQLPLELLRAIVGCSSNEGGLVLDPFNGSGTTGAAAMELERRYIGIEREKKFYDKASRRLSGYLPL